MWPSWSDTLPSSGGQRLEEGGQRLVGQYKIGTADEPLVSYITVVKNNAALLPRALESVRMQTYQMVEHIVLDGASTDDSVDVLRRNDSTLAYYASEPDNGIYHALNKAIPLARGSVICVLNSDDWLEPEAAQIAVNCLTGKTCALLATSVQFGSVLLWSPIPVHPGTYFSCMHICHNGVYATNEAYERSGPYDASYKVTADFKWVMTCVDKNIEFVYSDIKTMNFSCGGISGNVRQNALDTMRVIQERFPFLRVNEIQGLYYSFYRNIGSFAPFLDFGPPEDLRTFIKKLLLQYADRTEFITALSWALWEKYVDMAQLQDVRPSARLSSGLREGIKTMLRGTALFEPCKRLYRVLTGHF